MKSNLFKTVLKEEYIEVDKSVQKTIAHLREFSSSYNKDLPADTYMHFFCSKKGEIEIRYTYRQTDIPQLYSRHKTFENMYPLYCVYGDIFSKDSKTYIKINWVYKKYNLYLRYLLKIIGVAFLPLYLLVSIPFKVFKLPLFLILAIITIAIFLDSDAPLAAQKSRGLIMLPLMGNEIKRRVEIIEKWED